MRTTEGLSNRSNLQTQNRLDVLDVMLEVIRSLRPVLVILKRADANLEDQLRRAATSTALNLGEANGSQGGNRRARFFTALGSAREVRTALRVAEAYGYIDAKLASELDAQVDRVIAMTWRLTQSR